MNPIPKLKQFVKELKDGWASLKMDIRLSELEVEIYQRLERHTNDFQSAVENELQQLKTVDENFPIESFEDNLTTLQVFLETEIDEELQRIENNNQKIQRVIQNPHTKEYHADFSSIVEQAVQTEREEAQRLAESVDSVVARLDVNANPAEMARLLDQIGEEQTQQSLRQISRKVDQLEEIIAENQVMRYYGIWSYLERMGLR